MSKPSSDRAAISRIIDGLIERGCTPTMSRDGENEDLPYTSKKEALDWLTSCDEGVLFVDLPEGAERSSSFIYFVLGNSPEEVACDYGVALSPYLDPIINPWWE